MVDIQSRKDIVELVDQFYQQILSDDLIGVFFNEIVKLDVDKHMPIMYDFWETTLLGNITYKGNAMLKHIQLNRMKAIEEKHFARWIHLWENTINNNFEGEKASLAIKRATQIAELMKYKIKGDF